MKVLLVHNFYGSSAPSGENQMFNVERELLLGHGHEVKTFTRHSDEIRDKGILGKIAGALVTPWNHRIFLKMCKVILEFQPDVVHVHNTFPLISPAIFYAVGARVARVLTLHNYRLFCPAAIPMRTGRVCTECLDRKTVWPGVRYGCYRNSRLATVPLAVNVALHRSLGTWVNRVEAFITLTEFQRELMISAGLPAGRVHAKPNFYPGTPMVAPWSERRPYVVFAGRLAAEKGVEALIRAWQLWGPDAPELHIVGDGVLRGELERHAATDPRVPIRFLGQQAGESARAEIAHSRLLVLPSEGFETFGMAVCEAFALGTPVAVSDIGPLSSIVRTGVNGVLFPPGNPQSLLESVRGLWNTEGELERLAIGARQSFVTLYNEEVNYLKLMEIYSQAVKVQQQRVQCESIC